MIYAGKNIRTTLVLNEAWMPIQIATARVAIGHIIRDRVTPLGKDHSPCREEWPTFSKEEFEKGEYEKHLFYEDHPYITSANHIWPLPTIVVTTSRFFPSLKSGKISLKRLAAYYDNRCQICGEKFPLSQLTIEHVIPLSKGGANDMTNMLPTCKKCNNAKADIHPYYDYDGVPLKNKIKKASVFMHIEEEEARPEWKPFLFKS